MTIKIFGTFGSVFLLKLSKVLGFDIFKEDLHYCYCLAPVLSGSM